MSGDAMNERSLVDWSVARRTVQGDEELLRELISTFMDELPQMMRVMRAGVESTDANSLQRSAHTLKGALGHFGAHEAYQLALALEDQGRKANLEGATQTLQCLERAMAQLTPVLLDYVRGGGMSCGE